MKISFCKDIYQMLCKKYPNSNIYVIGDQHFFHKNIISYSRNQFADVSEMNQHIITKHNQIVGENDIVIFLGDFSFQHNSMKEILEHMNGHKYLILGNHDSENLVKKFSSIGFEEVFTHPIQVNQNYLSHEPLIDGERSDFHFNLVVNEFKKHANGVNYHGHIHDKNHFISPSYYNASCEVVDYQPVLIGKTNSIALPDEVPLFINSPYFSQMLEMIKKENSIDPTILISDYIYSYFLEICSSYFNDFFVNGSFGLLKKYQFLSKMSDLDISFLYDSNRSKKKNATMLKSMIDESYEHLKKIDRINLNFQKRFDSLRIFEADFTSQNPYFSRCFLDANLVFLDCYKEDDFSKINENSLIQKFVSKNSMTMLQEFHFPQFQAQVLTPEGDIANALLQLFFKRDKKRKK